MNDAPCSCLVSTYVMEDLDSASISRMFSSPGMPKTCVTPSFSRHSTISSAVERDCSPMPTSLTAAGERLLGLDADGDQCGEQHGERRARRGQRDQPRCEGSAIGQASSRTACAALWPPR